MKIASGFVPMATRMMMNKQYDSDLCPRCESGVENIEHLLACPVPEAAKLRKKTDGKNVHNASRAEHRLVHYLDDC